MFACDRASSDRPDNPPETSGVETKTSGGAKKGQSL